MVFKIGRDESLILAPSLTMLKQSDTLVMLVPSGNCKSADEIRTGEEEEIILVRSLCVVLKGAEDGIITMEGNESLRHVDDLSELLSARVVVASVVVRDVDPRLHV